MYNIKYIIYTNNLHYFVKLIQQLSITLLDYVQGLFNEYNLFFIFLIVFNFK